MIDSLMWVGMLKFKNIKKMKAFRMKYAENNPQQQLLNALWYYSVFLLFFFRSAFLYDKADLFFWSASQTFGLVLS